MSDRLRVVAGAVVRDGRVLVALRGRAQALPGYWELPGGKVERGEADAVALARELHEELGVHVEVGEVLGESAWDGGRRPILLVAYACRILTGEPRALEHAEVAWVGADDLDDLGWAPADRPLLAPLRDVLVGR